MTPYRFLLLELGCCWVSIAHEALEILYLDLPLCLVRAARQRGAGHAGERLSVKIEDIHGYVGCLVVEHLAPGT